MSIKQHLNKKQLLVLTFLGTDLGFYMEKRVCWSEKRWLESELYYQESCSNISAADCS